MILGIWALGSVGEGGLLLKMVVEEGGVSGF